MSLSRKLDVTASFATYNIFGGYTVGSTMFMYVISIFYNFCTAGPQGHRQRLHFLLFNFAKNRRFAAKVRVKNFLKQVSK